MTNAFEEEVNALYAGCHPGDSHEIVRLLGPLFAKADRYVPVFCSYVEALYDLRRLDEAAAAALVLHERAAHDPDARPPGAPVPPEPMWLYRKARSTRSRDLAFAGDMRAAAAILDELVARGIATDIDRRTLDRYRAGHTR
jgi:hypothetical protein